MSARKPLTDPKGEVRELETEDLKDFRPADDVLSTSLKAKLGVRGPQKAPTKVPLSLRLSPSVIERFKASGTGWQTRIDAALIDWLKTHSPDEIVA